MPGAAVVTLVAVMVPPPASSNAVCLFGTIQQLAAHISAPPHGSGVQVDCKNACDKAWTVLLDLGTSAVQVRPS
jgi:hypothetical protein